MDKDSERGAKNGEEAGEASLAVPAIAQVEATARTNNDDAKPTHGYGDDEKPADDNGEKSSQDEVATMVAGNIETPRINGKKLSKEADGGRRGNLIKDEAMTMAMGVGGIVTVHDNGKKSSNEVAQRRGKNPSEEIEETLNAYKERWSAYPTTPLAPDGAFAAGSVMVASAASLTPLISSNSNNVAPAAAAARFLVPGAYRIYGPGARDDDDDELDLPPADSEEEVPVFKGFLPGQSPEELQRRQAEKLRRRVVALDEPVVQPMIDDAAPLPYPHSDNQIEGGRKEAMSTLCLILLMLFITSVTLGVTFEFWDEADPKVRSEIAPCVIGDVQDRYDRAHSIVSGITTPEVLADPSSPQTRALEWIVCQDQSSAALIDGRDPASGLLPPQPHGARGERSGEARVLRRYALATFYFATSQGEGWTDTWNFLSPDVHECAWHKNYTRDNFKFGDLDPAGFVCQFTNGTSEWHETRDVSLLDDGEREIDEMILNFRGEFLDDIVAQELHWERLPLR